MPLGNKHYKYFLYSRAQYDECTNAEANLGKTYIPGKVLVNGRWKPYTEISNTPSNNRFADAVIVAQGYIEDMKYQRNTNVWRTRI